MNENVVMLEQMRNDLGENWWMLSQSLAMKEMIEIDGGNFVITSKAIRFVLLLQLAASRN